MSTPDGHERILVVEDDEPMRRLIARTVSEAGHAVDTAADAAEARVWLAKSAFALVICDLTMPASPERSSAGGSATPILTWQC
jgi:DNA-binding response OmpR family regulator